MKNIQKEQCAQPHLRDRDTDHKNARSSHGPDSFFKRKQESRSSKRQELIEASLESSPDYLSFQN